jgi:hypothetical protein
VGLKVKLRANWLLLAPVVGLGAIMVAVLGVGMAASAGARTTTKVPAAQTWSCVALRKMHVHRTC